MTDESNAAEAQPQAAGFGPASTRLEAVCSGLGPHRTGVLPFPPLTGYWVNRLGAAFRTAVDRELRTFDLTRRQVATLAHVHKGLAASASDLTREMGVDSTAVTRMVDRLSEKGLLRRVRDPQDGRRQLLELTPAAHELMPRITEVARSVEASFEAGLPDDDLATFHRVLVTMLENVGEALTPKIPHEDDTEADG